MMFLDCKVDETPLTGSTGVPVDEELPMAGIECLLAERFILQSQPLIRVNTL